MLDVSRVYLNAEAERISHEYGDLFCHYGYVTNGLVYFMDFAFKDYFLSIPNVRDIDYFLEAIDSLDDMTITPPIMQRIGTRPSLEWCKVIYEECKLILARYHERWDAVQYLTVGSVLSMVSSGDYRIIAYNRMFGIGRVEAREFKKEEPLIVNDPFFVSDTITPEMDEDVYKNNCDTHIEDVEITNYANRYDKSGERVFLLTERDILESFILKEKFEYSKMDEQTIAEIKRLKATHRGKPKDEKRDTTKRAVIKRRLSGDTQLIIRHTWDFNSRSLSTDEERD